MSQLITGIHHVTAIAADAQKNIGFYTGVLGLQLVKKTVNFDAPEIYHFYYGDDTGNPGSLITFFPYRGLAGGRHGKGMLNTTGFSVAFSSLDYWLERLQRFGIPHKNPQERFDDEVVVYFEDPDGLGLELVFNNSDTRPGLARGTVAGEHSIRGLYNVEIWEEGYELTAGLLTERMNHRLIAEKGNRFRFAATDHPGNYVDILCYPDALKGLAGSGTVHHIAFNTADTGTQDQVRSLVSGRNPSEVRDRKYFCSIYFREPGGVLFEVATAGPGFIVDEAPDELGKSLKLPPQFEERRSELEKILPVLNLSNEHYK